jgi:hypothetical protein
MVEFYYYIPEQVRESYINVDDDDDYYNIDSYFDQEILNMRSVDEIDELINEIRENPTFCRSQEAITQSYFERKLYTDITIFIRDSDFMNKIVGALTLELINHRDANYPIEIFISGLCVPSSSPKRYGTQLINKVKQLANVMSINGIYLEACRKNCNFYRKLGFRISEEESELPSKTDPMLFYYILLNNDYQTPYNEVLENTYCPSQINGGKKLSRKSKKLKSKKLKSKKSKTNTKKKTQTKKKYNK